MSVIRIFTTRLCPYCLMAKRLLARKGVRYQEIPVDGDPQQRERMCQEAGGGWTVPQIFIGDRHIGGFDDMAALDQAGGLDPLLEQIDKKES